MFETIVAFFVLTIVLMLIYQMISFCGQLRMKAADTSNVINGFNQDMYRGEITTDGSLTSETTVGSIKVTPRSTNTEISSKGPLFYITVSTDTSDDNIKSGKAEDYQTIEYRLRLNHIHANSLVSQDSRIAEEGLVTPKALQFYYNK